MPDPAVPDVVHACVVSGGPHGIDTHYFGAGRGTPVLLLSGNPAISGLLIGGLPRHFRSIAPKLPSTEAPRTIDFNPWLRGFLDALGIARVAVVVGPCHAAQVLRFALMEPERVSRLVFLMGPCGDGDGDNDGRGIADRLAQSGQPLLATPLDLADAVASERAVTEIASFLSSDAEDIA